jgi:hypothetical protein
MDGKSHSFRKHLRSFNHELFHYYKQATHIGVKKPDYNLYTCQDAPTEQRVYSNII